MSLFDRVIFNLLLNTTMSLLAGLLVVLVVLKTFKISDSHWKIFFLSLPFMKIVWDLFHGIPKSSVLYSGLNPLLLPPKHQTLRIGFGFDSVFPQFNLSFSSQALNGKEFSTSVPDYLLAYIDKKEWTGLPHAVIMICAAISAFLLLRRLIIGFSFSQTVKKSLLSGKLLRETKVGFRTVRIVSSPGFTGTPFTGGIFNPYICFPEDTLNCLSNNEFEAVLKHELAHIKSWDLLTTLIIHVAGDLFWFVPGFRFLSRKIDRTRELVADQNAVLLGGSATDLASALVKLGEIDLEEKRPILYSAFFREPSLLKKRVSYLIEPSQHATRFGWSNRYLRPLIAVWCAGAVFVTTFAGNHEVEKFPEWLDQLLKRWGLI